MEKELVTVVIILMVIVLIAVVIYGVTPLFLKIQKKTEPLLESQDTKTEYKKIINQSTAEYELFMQQQNKLRY